jgi:hypothetical protein
MTASANATITVTPDVAVTVTITNVGAPIAPMAAGAVAANIAVVPSTWTGALALSGANAGSFVVGPSLIIAGTLYAGQLLVGSSALASGSYAVTVTANP